MYSQSGYTLTPKDEELDKEIDEGFGDMNVKIHVDSPSLLASELDITIASSEDPDGDSDDDLEETGEDENVHSI